MIDYYVDAIKRYAVFEGRSTRKEYWMFVLMNVIIGACFGFGWGLSGAQFDEGLDTILTLYQLFIFIPYLSIGVRRLHDIGWNAWAILPIFIPILGWMYWICIFTVDSEKGENKYGPYPPSKVK